MVTENQGNNGESADLASVKQELQELRDQMGEAKDFPKARIGGYMSHFRIVIEVTIAESRRVISIVSPLAAQSVAWSDPFVYGEQEAGHTVSIPKPKGSQLPDKISETDFIEKPSEFFVPGKETIWLQILNLDARMNSDLGPIRIILGETLKREYPDIFHPSLGAAQSLGKRGFPARLFFNPLAISEPFTGCFRMVV